MWGRLPAKSFWVKVQVIHAVFMFAHVVAVVTFDVEVVAFDVFVLNLK